MVGVKVVLLNFLPSLKTALYINFKKLAPPLILGWLRPCEGPRRKTEKFWQIEKKIIDLYELDNSKKKIFFEKKFSK